MGNCTNSPSPYLKEFMALLKRQSWQRACVSLSVGSDSATPRTAARQAPLSVGLPRQECWSEGGSHAPLQGIFPTQGSNPGLLHCRGTLHHLSHQGNPWEHSEQGLCLQKDCRTLEGGKESITGFLTVSQIKPLILSPRVVQTHLWTRSFWCLGLGKDVANSFFFILTCFLAWLTQASGEYQHSKNSTNWNPTQFLVDRIFFHHSNLGLTQITRK